MLQIISSAVIYPPLCCNELFPLLSDFSVLQGNPVGQSGLGMAYLYGRGVQVVSVCVAR